MQEETVLHFDTDFAPADRLGREGLIRQSKTWSHQKPTQLISNAVPDLLLILNSYRQIVFANDRFSTMLKHISNNEVLGLRPGELMNCVHSIEKEGGCGSTRFCSECGAVNAILRSLHGMKDTEECHIERANNLPSLDLRVWTTPVELEDEKYTIFAVQDISLEKENQRLLDEVQKLAILDPLSEIYNRRIFFDLANREIIRSLRYHNPFSILMIDLDRFKEVNDTFGHPAGDAVIKEVVRLIQSNLREIDTFARYGGDEFIILLPETGLVGGKKVADRLMQAGDRSVLQYKDFEISTRYSVGVAEYIFDVDHDIDDVISRADEELFKVKKLRKQVALD